MKTKTITGYLSGVANPHFSGLATITLRTNRNPRRGKYTTCYCDAGFGVRQLAAAFTDNGYFTKASGEIKARFVVDGLGLLQSVEPLGAEF